MAELKDLFNDYLVEYTPLDNTIFEETPQKNIYDRLQ